MGKVNIAISDSLNLQLNLYQQYIGTSYNACVIYLLSRQTVKYYKYNDDFTKSWNQLRPKPTSDPIKKSLKVSDELSDDIFNISSEMKVKTSILTSNMIRMELKHIFENLNNLSYLKKYIKNGELEIPEENNPKSKMLIPTSNIFKFRLEIMAKKIGIPTNSLVSHAIAEYLNNHFQEYNSEVYVDKDSGKMFTI